MRIARFLTVFVVVVLCGTAMSLGLGIVSLAAKAEIGPTDPGAYRHWVNIPGIEFTARDEVLTAIEKSGAQRTDAKLLEAISQILAVKPVSTAYWLSLARIRLRSGQHPDDVMNAWQLSVLTGPNEGKVLPWRGLFGLKLWDIASVDVRNRTIAEVRDSLRYLNSGQAAFGRALLTDKPKEFRQKIRLLLRAEGATERELGYIGLQ